MQAETEAIVCGVRGHGEHGIVVRLLTPEHGLVAAYVRGGRGRRIRPMLIPGNVVAAQLRSRTDGQLPQATLELAHSRAPILTEALPAAAIAWATALVAASLPERQPYPRLFEALGGLLDAVEAAPRPTRSPVSSCCWCPSSAMAVKRRILRRSSPAGALPIGTESSPRSICRGPACFARS